MNLRLDHYKSIPPDSFGTTAPCSGLDEDTRSAGGSSRRGFRAGGRDGLLRWFLQDWRRSLFAIGNTARTGEPAGEQMQADEGGVELPSDCGCSVDVKGGARLTALELLAPYLPGAKALC